MKLETIEIVPGIQGLARKYRPKKFSEVIEQVATVQAIKNALSKKTASPAYLFFGPRGCGKTTLARLIARRVNCLNVQEDEPCGVCDSCKAIENNSSLDVIEIDAASHRGIDYIRELRENVKFRPMQFYKKVYIIDEVHMLTTESFNALLKTLEEPPAHVVFILATTESHKVPQTILSRCQVFNLTKVPLSHLQDYLKYLCKCEKVNFDDEAIFWIARTGDGSLRDSISFLEQCIHYCGIYLESDKIKELLGLGPKLFDYYVEFTLGLIKPEMPISDLVLIVRKNFEAGLDLQRFIWEYLNFLRTLVFIKKGIQDNDFLALPTEQVQTLQNKFSFFDLSIIQCIFNDFFNLLKKTQGLDLRNTFEMGLLIEMELMDIKEKLSRPSLTQIIQKLNLFSVALANSPNSKVELEAEIKLEKTNQNKIQNISGDTSHPLEHPSEIEAQKSNFKMNNAEDNSKKTTEAQTPLLEDSSYSSAYIVEKEFSGKTIKLEI